MKKRRRIILQLTPMLDLMLTVLFVQAILLKGVSMDAVDAKTKVATTLAASRDMVSRYKQDNEGLTRERNDLRDKLKTAEDRLAAATESQLEAEERVKEINANMERIANLAKNIFDVSEETVLTMTAGMNDNQAARIRAELERIQKENPSEALKELMKLDELRKRCDFWGLHVSYDGQLEFFVNDKKIASTFIQKDFGPEPIVNAMEDAASQLQEPKSIVLVVLTHANPETTICRLAKHGVKSFLSRRNTMPNSKSKYELSEWGYVHE